MKPRFKAKPYTSCWTWTHLFSYLQNVTTITSSTLWIVIGLNEQIHVKLFEQCLIIINIQYILAMIITTCAWAVAQLCLTFCNAMDCSLPGSSVHGISQARKLEWVAISFSRGSSRPRNQPSSPVSPVLAGRFFTTASPGKLIITMGLCNL